MNLPRTTLIIYVSDPLVAQALRQITTASSDIDLLGAATTGPELLRLASLKPNVALLTVPYDSELNLVPMMQRESPGSKIVLWVHRSALESEEEATVLGVHGVLRSGQAPERVLDCIRKVHSGGLWFEPASAQRPLIARKENLTPRESGLVSLMAQGLTNQEIAALLGSSEAAVKAYVSRLLAKTGLQDRVELALFGLQRFISSTDSKIVTSAVRTFGPAS